MTTAVILVFLKTHWLKIVITLIILGVVVTGYSCYVDYKQEQVQQALNIERQKVIDAMVAEEVADVEGKREDAINKGSNTNEANKKLDDARNTDSSRSNTNASAVKQRFCTLYPDDSLCQ